LVAREEILLLMDFRPNIIVIFPDQLRRDALSCSGDPNVKTPHIDLLAQSGARFQNASSVHPVCVPARFCLMTGQYPHTRMIPTIGWRMSPSERTIAHELNEANYETCYVGKWHLYGGAAKGSIEHRRKIGTTQIPPEYRGGFQRWRGFEFRNDHFDTFYFVDDDPVPTRIEGYQTDGLFDASMRFMESERDLRRPFFLILSVEAPHFPFDAPEEYRKRWEGRELLPPPNINLAEAEKLQVQGSKSKHFWDDFKTYYAMIENLDDNVGRLMAFLQNQGLKDDTAIVFYSDHGEMMGSHGLKGKNYAYEESAAVPLIISYSKGGVIPGQVYDSPVSTIDLLPTIRGLAGLDAEERNPGINLLPLISGESKGLARQGILLEGEAKPGGMWRCWRTERYKYTVHGDELGGKPWQLFDLKNDPYELTNLIAHPDCQILAKDLHGALRESMLQNGDHYALEPAFGYPGLNMGY
jgi:arylsulfatase A-like enzyme